MTRQSEPSTKKDCHGHVELMAARAAAVPGSPLDLPDRWHELDAWSLLKNFGRQGRLPSSIPERP